VADAQALRVVHADPWLVVVDKPSGLLSQPGLGPEQADAVVGRLRAALGELRLVHRLDRDTSGLLLLARDADSHRALSRAFAERRVAKTYRAEVWGCPAHAAGVIEAPLARARRRPPLYRVHPAGRPSRTDWRRLDGIGSGGAAADGSGATSWLELRPHTGRSHQLRVHLAWLGHPILGDPLYGPARSRRAASRLRLHACGLAFEHPATGRWLELASEPPWEGTGRRVPWLAQSSG
jgi:tRNA pseudouridine32 synthase/23S rRNA pseudouridine746 synthase